MQSLEKQATLRKRGKDKNRTTAASKVAQFKIAMQPSEKQATLRKRGRTKNKKAKTKTKTKTKKSR